MKVSKSLFFKYGVKRVTVEEICKTAGISKMTFYKYFKDKNQIAETIRDELLDYGFSKYDEINQMNIPYPEKIDLITKWRVEFFSSFSQEFIEDMMDMEDTLKKIKVGYLQNIKEAQEKGEVRKEFSPEFIWLVTEKLNELVQDGSWKTIFSDYKDFQIQMRTLYFYGLLEDPHKE